MLSFSRGVKVIKSITVLHIINSVLHTRLYPVHCTIEWYLLETQPDAVSVTIPTTEETETGYQRGKAGFQGHTTGKQCPWNLNSVLPNTKILV